ncbi:MAG: GNAT family N-acetyltransferase [Anaerolineae bacterium]|nr:GNAT family N-acetyltransferase [Anaerolineae bacterium]
MHIIDMPTDEVHLQQAAETIMLAFAENWPGAWDTLEEGLEELREMMVEERICLAALIDERVIGWIGGIPEYDGNVWELHPLVVHPDHQGQGVGRALVQAFEQRVAEKGAVTIMLGSDDENLMTSLGGTDLYDNLHHKIATIRNLKGHPYEFYQKMGYAIVGVIPDANGPGKPDILMAKRVKH